MSEKILVVDDEPLILSTIERALGKKGYDVRGTSSAEEFMGELSKETADLLIMDVNLHGRSSEALLGKVREIAPRAKFLFISGVTPNLDMKNFLEKPFNIEDLRQKVRDILDGIIPG